MKDSLYEKDHLEISQQTSQECSFTNIVTVGMNTSCSISLLP